VTGSADKRGAPEGPRSVCLVGLIAGGHSGVPRYAAKLAEALDRASTAYPELRLSLLTTVAGAEAIEPRSLPVRTVGGTRSFVNAGPGRLLLEQVAARSARADLLHYFDLSGPVLAPRRPFVTTIHDMSPLHGFRKLQNTYKRRLFPWALARAAASVAVSQFAKDEAVELLGADPSKIHVVHSGPGLSAGTPAAASGSAPEEPFLLYVGNLSTNKNLPMLVRAFHRTEAPVRLVLAGRPREGAAEVREAVAGGRRAGSIELREDPSDDVVDALYRAAVALLLPSTYEGFGFTPLEAMARGCPVLASDIPALREIAGEGALLLPPHEEERWREAMDQVARDVAFREDLRVRGAATVARYSWDSTAHGVLRLFGTLGLPQPQALLEAADSS
jgi:glycosyltransferase involved in cell wall biosynthesis